MSLNIQLQQMLDENASNGGTGLQEMSLQEARDALQQSFRNKGYPIKHPVDIKHYDITGPKGSFSADIYRPLEASAAIDSELPVLLYFHGGGFVLGDDAACEMQSRAFAYLLNVAVVFVNYRLAPEHVFPAALDDTKAVVDWLGENAKSLKLDAKKIVTCGESAGGNLATHAAMHANAEAGKCKAIASTLFYPVTDLRPFYQGTPVYPSMQSYGVGFNLDIAELDWFWQHYLASDDQANHPDNSLLLHDKLGQLANVQIIVAECDPLRDMGLAFATKLQETGVTVHVECLPGMLHSFMFHGAVCAQALRHFYRIVESIDKQFQLS